MYFTLLCRRSGDFEGSLWLGKFGDSILPFGPSRSEKKSPWRQIFIVVSEKTRKMESKKMILVRAVKPCLKKNARKYNT